VEDALQIEVPITPLVRNLIAAPTGAGSRGPLLSPPGARLGGRSQRIKADPVKTAQIASSLSEWPKSGASHFKAVQTQVRTLVESGH